MTALRQEIAELRERVTAVIVALSKGDAKSAPSHIDFTRRQGMFLADPGAAKLWQVAPTGNFAAIANRGTAGMGAPQLISTLAEVVYTMDEAGRLFRLDTTGTREIRIRDRQFREPVDFAVFVNNLYVLDRISGQVWKYEPSADGHYGGSAIAFLAQPVGPGIARSIGVDGDVWIGTDAGQVVRFRRPAGSVTAVRVDFSIRWSGDPLLLSHVQAREEEASIYGLDAASRRVVQFTREGREVARVALPTELDPPQGFVVLQVDGGPVVMSLHADRVARTDFPR